MTSSPTPSCIFYTNGYNPINIAIVHLGSDLENYYRYNQGNLQTIMNKYKSTIQNIKTDSILASYINAYAQCVFNTYSTTPSPPPVTTIPTTSFPVWAIILIIIGILLVIGLIVFLILRNKGKKRTRSLAKSVDLTTKYEGSNIKVINPLIETIEPDRNDVKQPIESISSRSAIKENKSKPTSAMDKHSLTTSKAVLDDPYLNTEYDKLVSSSESKQPEHSSTYPPKLTEREAKLYRIWSQMPASKKYQASQIYPNQYSEYQSIHPKALGRIKKSLSLSEDTLRDYS